ncbi:MAG: hypothetical protein Ct9H300mP28_24150 [Pseudomonadota bacterium]|nr:MAG: hypothetical protein Ct9H300mP28_24150 [Pseudomonadota bacterium]
MNQIDLKINCVGTGGSGIGLAIAERFSSGPPFVLGSGEKFGFKKHSS